jgi:hypothetical protein
MGDLAQALQRLRGFLEVPSALEAGTGALEAAAASAS